MTPRKIIYTLPFCLCQIFLSLTQSVIFIFISYLYNLQELFFVSLWIWSCYQYMLSIHVTLCLFSHAVMLKYYNLIKADRVDRYWLFHLLSNCSLLLCVTCYLILLQAAMMYYLDHCKFHIVICMFQWTTICSSQAPAVSEGVKLIFIYIVWYILN